MDANPPVRLTFAKPSARRSSITFGVIALHLEHAVLHGAAAARAAQPLAQGRQ
jgi:hypothetical protein